MATCIEFNNLGLHFLGRNGCCRCRGLEISKFAGTVELAPTTGRGATGRCWIELPLDADVLDKVSATIQKIADSLRAERG